MRRDLPVDVTDVEFKGSAAAGGLALTPHPLTSRDQRLLTAIQAPVLPGDTLLVFLARYEVVPHQQWLVSIGGAEVPEAMWPRLRPKPGYLIEARRVPEKGVLALAAIVALSYFTFGAGGMLGVGGLAGSFLGLTGAAGWVAAGAAYLAGSMVINKLLGPKAVGAAASTTANPTYSLQGGRNSLRPFEPMGLVLGEPYCVPDLAAQPYTYFFGGQQYLWQLFHAGLNCADVTALRIGQNAIENYAGVVVTREGFEGGNTGLPIISTDIDTVSGALLDAPTGFGPYVARTGSANTIVLMLDVVATIYEINTKNGAPSDHTADFSIEYRPLGSSTWLPFASETQNTISITNNGVTPLRLTYQRQVPAGQYEVRMQKRTPNSPGNPNISNTIEWSNMKSFQLDTGNYAGQARLAMQIMASGQLNGSLDQLNWQARARPATYWNGSSWITASTRANGLCNPGTILLQLARGIYDETGRMVAGLGLTDNQIDFEGLKLFMVRCAAMGFEFDLFLQEATTVGDLLEVVAAAGMGAVAWPDGKFGVIFFTESQPVEGVLNMATFKAKSFSVDYDTAPTADEIEFQYFDRERGDVWTSIRIAAPGVTNPTNVARQKLQGVTTERHAALLGRFYMAQNVFQRKTVTCDVDLEHMTFRRGTVLALSHDVTQWGYGGRLKAAVNAGGTVTLTLDDVVPAASPGGVTSRYIGLRLAGERQMRIFPVAGFSGSSGTVSLAVSWPAGVALPGDSADNPAWDTVWIYDFKSTPGQRLRVASCMPQGNLAGARVALVPDTPEFWDYVLNGTYAPPPSGSLLSRSVPSITSARVTEALLRQGNTFYTELTIGYEARGTFDHVELWGTLGAEAMQRLGASSTQTIRWRGGMADVWALELRIFTPTRAGVAFPLTYAVVGLKTPPANVVSFAVDADGRATWSDVSDVDLAGYALRWQPGLNTSWGDASPLHDGLVTDNPYLIGVRPVGVATFMIKAVDTTGNESVLPAASVINLGDPKVANIFASQDFAAAGFPGTLTNCSVIAGELVADVDGSPLAWDPNPLTAGWTADADPGWTLATFRPLTYLPPPFIVGPADEGAQLTLGAAIVGSSYLVEYRGAATGGPVDEWRPWPGTTTARAGTYEWRITTQSRDLRSKVTALVARLDVADQFESIGLVTISAAGTIIPTAKAWRSIVSIGLTLVADGGAAVTCRIEDRPTRTVTARNAANAAVAGTVLATLQGY